MGTTWAKKSQSIDVGSERFSPSTAPHYSSLILSRFEGPSLSRALAPSLPDLSKIKNVRHANEPAIKHSNEIGLFLVSLKLNHSIDAFEISTPA